MNVQLTPYDTKDMGGTTMVTLATHIFCVCVLARLGLWENMWKGDA